MPKLHHFIVAAAFAALAHPLSAQGVGSLSDGSLAMGQSVEAAPNQAPDPNAPEDVTTETIGDWQVQCASSGPEPRPCRLYQLMKDDNGNPISEITLFSLPQPDGQAVAGATVIVPLETLLTAQLTVTVDGDNARRYPFAFCNQVGCISRIGLSQDDVDGYKSGDLGKLVIVPAVAPDQTVTVNMSLKGFTKAFDALNGGAD